mmetsp:Transcript_2500/g.3624  ORF Transcript_2500/g.3624 Transcript_2500/m.3624 type:complete len:93 (-) Transcript_2500:13-291(-)
MNNQYSQMSSMQQQQQQYEAALMEAKLISNMFEKLTPVCYEKCLNASSHNNDSLSPEELECASNCVSKYFATQKLVGDNFSEQQQQMQANQY